MEKEKKRILIITNGTSGLYSFRRELLEELCKRYPVYVLAKPSGHGDQLKEIGCQIIPTDIEYHGKNPIKELKLYSYYKAKMKELRPDVVLTYTIKPNIYGGMACASLKIPCIANITGLGNALENTGLMQRATLVLYRLGLKKTARVFFQNRNNMEYMVSRKIVSGSYALLPGSGVNLEQHCLEPYPSLGASDPLVLTVMGRMIPEKGIREILSAAHRLQGENIRIRLIGTCQDPILSEIRALEPEGCISFLGFRGDPHEWYKTSHAVLHASYHEGMSNVLLEAAACGRPVLATDVPGCRETYTEGVSGFGFPPKDADAIVAAILRFRELPYEKKREMGLMGRKHVEAQFDRQKIVNTYLNTITEIIQ